MEVRVSALESRLARLETVIDDLRKEVQTIRVDLAEIKGRLANVPTTFQLLYIQTGLIVAIFGAAIAVLRLAPAH